MKIWDKLREYYKIILIIAAVIIVLLIAVKYTGYVYVAIIVGPFAAILTVMLEYKKDQIEKLSDRKSLWLNKHWETIGEGMMNLYYGNIRRTNLENWDNFPYNNSFTITRDKLDALMVNYRRVINNETSFQVIIDNHENQYKSVYGDIIEHLRSGYMENYNMFNNLIDVENEYAKCLKKPLNDILKYIDQLMRDNFPRLKKIYDDLPPNNRGAEYYNLGEIFQYLIDNNLDNGKSHITPVFHEMLGFVWDNTSSSVKVFDVKDRKEAVKFKKNVWDALNDKFSKIIWNLEKKHEAVVSKEEEFKKSLKGIIELYLTGYRIEGFCEECETVLHENNIEKLRPKL